MPAPHERAGQPDLLPRAGISVCALQESSTRPLEPDACAWHSSDSGHLNLTLSVCLSPLGVPSFLFSCSVTFNLAGCSDSLLLTCPYLIRNLCQSLLPRSDSPSLYLPVGILSPLLFSPLRVRPVLGARSPSPSQVPRSGWSSPPCPPFPALLLPAPV